MRPSGRVRRAGATGPITLRADSGFWSSKIITACGDHDVRYSITVRQTKTVVAAIEQIDEAVGVDIAYPDGGKAQVAETTVGDHQRLIVRRTRLVGAQAQLFPDWRHHAFVTDRAGTAVDLDADHRHHAVCELAIRDLKHGAGLVHCPSGVFTANAAWAVLASLAHNVLRWTTRLGGLATGPVVAKTIRRRRYLTIPGGDHPLRAAAHAVPARPVAVARRVRRGVVAATTRHAATALLAPVSRNHARRPPS